MRNDQIHQPAWPWLILAIGGACLLFQLVPTVWLSAISALDVTHWTWRAYAVLCSVALVALCFIRAWRQNSD